MGMESPAPDPSHPRWLLDELATVGRENLDPDHVARYDDKEDANATGELALLFEHGLDQRCEVVDLGAGTGQLTLAVATVCARVVAVDVSPLMLARLRIKVAASGLANVEVVQTGFLTYERRAQPADIVYSPLGAAPPPRLLEVGRASADAQLRS